MPNYEFDCGECEQAFHIILKVDDRDEAQKCPHCGTEKTKRNLGSFTTANYRKFHFKAQVREAPKSKKNIHLGYKTKPTRWGFSKH